MTYELWDLDTGNMLGDFQTKSAALAAVRRISAASGGTDELALEKRDRLGRSTLLTGRELLEWAQVSAAQEARAGVTPRFAYGPKSGASKWGVWSHKGVGTLSMSFKSAYTKMSKTAHYALRDSRGRFVSRGKKARKK